VVAAKDRFHHREKELLADLLRRGAEAGELVAAAPEATATALVQAYAVFSPPALFELRRSDVPSLLSAMHQLVLRGLLARPGP
jgi:hypothetical protein